MFRYSRPGPGQDPFDARLRSRDAANELGGEFSVNNLAVYFGLPGLTRDLYPIPPWAGAERVRPAPPRPDGTSDPEEFTDRFRAAVADAMGDHDHVAIAGSGGMDSAALIDTAARLCRRDGRRLIVVVLDIADDTGRRTRSLVARQLEFLRADAELVAVSAQASMWPEPPWGPAGPRFDAWPRLHAGLVQAAADRGATVLLQGNGADQLLQVPLYLAAEFARRREWRAGASYRADTADGGGINRLLAATGRIGGAARAQLYWATAWPGFTTDRGAPVLTDQAAIPVREWMSAFQEESLRVTVAARATWAEATLMHRLFPYDLLADAGDIPEIMPFLDPTFARYSYHLPLTARFAPEQPNAYMRGKGLVARLLPAGFETVLAGRRQRCYKAYRRYWQAVVREPDHSLELGLIRPDWRRHCRDAFDIAMTMSCETWIRGALDRGAVPAGRSAVLQAGSTP
ncbi:asparagine synthase-related protein [Rhizohabitans arisaemae]|uniref:asparagine synthase-related protein n=1 Tax=Rhizohabitans arisaemae TaxID=2720610 RepID=UPI0024B2250A|nr:asparagine synthase-related protein [Rhizohabitans arisaemae]